MMRHKISGEKNQKGQALIIILLVMSVVLTVVLSSVSRSVTEIVVTGYEEDALRAFSAAEAGVEEKLLNIGTVGAPPETVDLETEVSYTVEVAYRNIADESGKKIEYPEKLSSGETATFLVTSRNEDGQFVCDGDHPCWYGIEFRVCYGKPGDTQLPAIEISVYYDNTFNSLILNNYEDVKIYKKVFDNSGRIPGSVLANTAGCDYDDDGTADFRYRAVIRNISPPAGDFPVGNCSTALGNMGCILFVKARLLYAENQPIGFWLVTGSSNNIPAQGILISSEGTAGESSRKVEVYRSHPHPLDLFDLAVFSLGELTK